MRRRKKAKATLERWAREEAAIDAQQALARSITANGVPVVPVSIQPSAGPPPEEPPARRAPPPSGLPKIEYEGRWHTLH